MKQKTGGGFIVCSDGRLQPVGVFQKCFSPKDAGTHIAVRLIERSGLPGYLAEIVVTPAIEPYKGPAFDCRLPEQFDRFLESS